MIDAKNFAAPNPPVPFVEGIQRRFRFGTDPRNIAQELRRFADAIDSGLILVQAVQTGQKASTDDWASAALYIEFVEGEIFEQLKAGHERIIELPQS